MHTTLTIKILTETAEGATRTERRRIMICRLQGILTQVATQYEWDDIESQEIYCAIGMLNRLSLDILEVQA